MHDLKNQAGAYLGNVAEASSRANGFIAAVALGWAALPFVVQTAFFHPSNAIKVQFILQGLPPPHAFTSQQLTVGFIEALVALCVLLLVQMCLTVLFYRNAKMQGQSVATPVLWPLAAFTVGTVGNGIWFYATGAFDPVGCMIGLSSGVLTVIAELVCNHLGREFVLGVGHAAQAPMLLGPASPMLLGPSYGTPSMQGPVFYHIPE
jgi:hypothetical protein